MVKEPQTPEEWQDVVNVAYVLLMVESARAYGLLTGGPEVNQERCEEILRRGRALGHTPDDQEALDSIMATMFTGAWPKS